MKIFWNLVSNYWLHVILEISLAGKYEMNKHSDAKLD